MNRYADIRFSGIGYTVLFDNKMKYLSSDNEQIAARILSCNAVKTAAKINRGCIKSFEHRFSYGTVRYRAVFEPFFERFYICRVYPEDCYIRCAYSELYKSISDIRDLAAVSVSENEKFNEAVISASDEEKYGEFYSDVRERSERIFSIASSILKIYDSKHIYEYVPIQKLLEKSQKQLRRNNSILNKQIAFNNDIKYGVAKMNYVLFDAALSGIARILYKCMEENDNAIISLSEKDKSSITIKAFLEHASSFDESALEYDINVLKSIFESIEGTVVISEPEDGLLIKGFVPAALSNFYNRIKYVRMFETTADALDRELQGLAESLVPHNSNVYEFNAPPAGVYTDISMLIWDITVYKMYEGLIV